jgi:hypothetical protein
MLVHGFVQGKKFWSWMLIVRVFYSHKNVSAAVSFVHDCIHDKDVCLSVLLNMKFVNTNGNSFVHERCNSTFLILLDNLRDEKNDSLYIIQFLRIIFLFKNATFSRNPVIDIGADSTPVLCLILYWKTNCVFIFIWYLRLSVRYKFGLRSAVFATPCNLVGGYQLFGGIYCLHLQCILPNVTAECLSLLISKINRSIKFSVYWRWKLFVPPKISQLHARLHGI